MRYKHSSVLQAASLLAFTLMTIPDAEAVNIGPGQTVTVPPPAAEAIVFTGASPGGTLVVNGIFDATGGLTNSGSGVGTLILNSGAHFTEAIGTPSSPIFAITVNANASITGATSAQTFNLGQNTLTLTGALNSPSGLVINTKVISNALFGNIAETGPDSISGPSATVNVDASGVIALTPGAPLFVISAQGPTGTLPINVTSNSALYSFIGSYLNGNITITPTLHPAIKPPPGVGTVLPGLLAVAAKYPGSDIATVLAAVAALPNAAAVENALLQFNPIVDNALPRMSFDAAKQFQQLWALHMTNGRCVYVSECDSDCYPNAKSVSREKKLNAKRRRTPAVIARSFATLLAIVGNSGWMVLDCGVTKVGNMVPMTMMQIFMGA